MGKAFHQRVREGFLEIAKSEPERCARIDASQAPGAVAAEVKGLAGARLGIDLK
jgi:dTMP kinase